MKGRIIAMALVAAALAGPGEAGVYLNARFGYGVDYPQQLIPQPESENGDGRAFRSADGRTEALVWGGYNALDQTPQELAREAEQDCAGSPAYERVTATLVAMSCVSGGRIIYQKTLIHGDVLTSLRITYPAAERARWDPIAARMSTALRRGR